MGFRMHVRTKSIIEYEGWYFNHFYDEIGEYICEECKSFHNEEYEGGAYWEIDRDEFKKLSDKIKENYKPDDIVIQGDHAYYTAEELTDIFDEILELTKNKINFDCPDIIHLDWF